MKPIAISGAIDRGIVTPQTRFDCEKGRWLYAGKILHDSHDCGIATVADIIITFVAASAARRSPVPTARFP